MLFELKTIQDLSLREADELIEEIAGSGYEGVILPRDGDWDLLRGFCRSAGKHSLKLWLRDDIDDPSGSFGGEVTSVPSFCSDKPELWGCAPYSSEAAEAFLDCSYMGMKRELSRFMGYELTGVVTRHGKEDEIFTKTHLRPISDFCEKNGLELIRQTSSDAKTAFADLADMSFAGRQRELCALYSSGARRIAVHAELYPEAIEAVWCAGADRLPEWLEGEPTPVELGVPAVRFQNGAYLLYNKELADVQLTLNMDELGAKYIADGITGEVYLPGSGELSVTLKEGGSLVLLTEAREAEPLPPLLSCGAVFTEPVKTDEAKVSLWSSDGCLAYRAELPADCGGSYLQLEGDFDCAFVKLGRRREYLLLPPFALPLYSVDGGRTAEIVIFPAGMQKTVSFGLNSANIVCVKN